MNSWLLLGLFAVPLLGGCAWLVWDLYFSNGSKSKIRVNLYDKVNNYYSFRTSFTVKIKKDKVLGEYIEKKKLGLFMAEPGSDYYIPSKKLDILNVVRYGVDDFRALKILVGNNFYKKVEEVVFEEIEELDERTGELKVIKKPKLNKDGSKVVRVVEKYFEEPLAVSSSDKEVARFGRDYYRRMEVLASSEDSFLKKNLPNIISLIVIALFFLFIIIFVRVEGKNTMEMNKYWADRFGDKADDAIKAINQPGFINNLVSRISGTGVNNNAPIS